MNARRTNCHKKLFAAMAGTGFTMGLLGTAAAARADSAVAWGYNNYGQLGNNSYTDSNVPIAVQGLTSGVTAVAAGEGFSLAIQNEAAVAWGYNGEGELGNSSHANSNVPVAVQGLTSGVTAAACGIDFGLAIQNGAVYAWGWDYDGELGYPTPVVPPYGSAVPVAVSGLSSGVTAIAAGGTFCLAIQNGVAVGWGYNGNGALGNGSYARTNVPVAVKGVNGVGYLSGVTAIATGVHHSLAIQNGAALAWGYNGSGQLGIGSIITNIFPVAVQGLTSGVTAIAGGDDFSLAIQHGNVYAWGNNTYGQLGNGSTTGSNTPIEIDPTDLSNIVAIAAGYESSYALSSDGSLWVWGDNTNGELGLGTSTSDCTTPQHLLAPSGYIFTSIDAGDGFHAVATLAAVPEPASLPLLALGNGLLMANRRKRRVKRL